jgi:prevent-host-death family protein
MQLEGSRRILRRRFDARKGDRSVSKAIASIGGRFRTRRCREVSSAGPIDPVLAQMAILATNATSGFEWRGMQTLSARDAKYNFGRLIDTARASPVTVEKHGRPVVVVLAVEEYQRLKAIESSREPEVADLARKDSLAGRDD